MMRIIFTALLVVSMVGFANADYSQSFEEPGFSVGYWSGSGGESDEWFTANDGSQDIQIIANSATDGVNTAYMGALEGYRFWIKCDVPEPNYATTDVQTL